MAKMSSQYVPINEATKALISEIARSAMIKHTEEKYQEFQKLSQCSDKLILAMKLLDIVFCYRRTVEEFIAPAMTPARAPLVWTFDRHTVRFSILQEIYSPITDDSWVVMFGKFLDSVLVNDPIHNISYVPD